MKLPRKKIIIAVYAFALATLESRAQSISFMDSNGTLIGIESQTTQTQVKPGWKIVDVQLKKKREYRQMRKPYLHENELTFVELKTFSISQYEDSEDTYVIRPTEDIQPGEYFFTWYGAATVGKMKDLVVWPFTIR